MPALRATTITEVFTRRDLISSVADYGLLTTGALMLWFRGGGVGTDVLYTRYPIPYPPSLLTQPLNECKVIGGQLRRTDDLSERATCTKSRNGSIVVEE